jgi:hypothetical protein
MRDAFDDRLKAMRDVVEPGEVSGAIAIYERLSTARSICRALLGDNVSTETIVAVMVELSSEVRARWVKRGLDAGLLPDDLG